MRSSSSLPETFLAEPWELVTYAGKLRLAYMVTYFGGGIVSGQFTGARGYLVTDFGELENDEPVIFQPAQLHKSWTNCPNSTNLNKARVRFAAEGNKNQRTTDV